MKLNLKENGHLVPSQVVQSKDKCLLFAHGWAGVACQGYWLADRINLLDITNLDLYTPVKSSLTLQLFFALLICILNNKTESCSESAIILNLHYIFISAGLIESLVNEALHGVQIKNMLGNAVVRIFQNVRFQWLIDVSELIKFEKHLPFINVRVLYFFELRPVMPLLPLSLQFLHLCSD